MLGISGLVVATTLTLASCGSQNPDPSGDPTVSESGTNQSDGSGSGDATLSGWQEAKIDVARLHVPADWSVLNPTATGVGIAAPKDELGFSPGGGSLVAGVHNGDPDVEASINGLAEQRLKNYQSDPNLSHVKRLPDVTVNGVLLAHVQWETAQTWDDEYLGVTTDGESTVGVVWQFGKGDLDRAGANELTDPVMETFELI